MNETARNVGPNAAEGDAYVRLEKDLAAVKNDVADLSHQIIDAVNALGEVARTEARRSVKSARSNVEMLASGASHRAASASDSLAGVIRERPIAAVSLSMGIGFLIGATWRR